MFTIYTYSVCVLETIKTITSSNTDLRLESLKEIWPEIGRVEQILEQWLKAKVS
jgi:hypothetical protein